MQEISSKLAPYEMENEEVFHFAEDIEKVSESKLTVKKNLKKKSCQNKRQMKKNLI